MKQKLPYRQRQPVFIPSPCGNTEELTCIAVVTDYLHSSKLSHFYIIFNTNVPYFSNTVGTQCGDGGGGKSNLDPVLQSGSKCQLSHNFLRKGFAYFHHHWGGYVGWGRRTVKDGAFPRGRHKAAKKVKEQKAGTWWPKEGRKEGALCSLRSLSPYCLPQL